MVVLIRSLLGNPLKLAGSVPDLSVRETKLLVSAGQHWAVQLADEITTKGQGFLRAVMSEVQISEGQHSNSIEQTGSAKFAAWRIARGLNDKAPILLECPLEIRRRGGEVRLVTRLRRNMSRTIKPRHSSALSRVRGIGRIWSAQAKSRP